MLIRRYSHRITGQKSMDGLVKKHLVFAELHAKPKSYERYDFYHLYIIFKFRVSIGCLYTRI